VPPCPLPRLEVTKLGVHMIHAPQAGMSQAHLVRILAGVVSADVPVGAGHAAMLEPAGKRRRINFLPAVLSGVERTDKQLGVLTR